MKTKKKKGFTLTELIVVIVIIGVLAAVLIPSLTGYITKAQNAKDETHVISLNKELNLRKIADDDINFYTAYDVQAYLESVGMANIEVANKKSIILFDTEINQFVLVKEDEKDDAFYTKEGDTKKLNNEGELILNPTEYYRINHHYYDEENGDIEGGTLISNKCNNESCNTHRAFIVSTNGSEIAKASSEFMNLNYNMSSDELKDLYNNFNEYKDVNVRTLVLNSISKSLFIDNVDGNNKAFYLSVEKVNNEYTYVKKEFNGGGQSTQVLTRVITTGNVTSLDLDLLDELQRSTIFISGSVESVKEIDSLGELINLVGNTSNIENLTNSIETDYQLAMVNLNIKEITYVNSYVKSEMELRELISKYKEITAEGSTVKTEIEALVTKYPNITKWWENCNVIVNDSFVIKDEITIPEGVILTIPYDSNGSYDGEEDTNKIIKLKETDTKKLNYVLTIADSMTVLGTLRVGGITDNVGQGTIGYTSSYYSQVLIEENCVLKVKGDVYVYGYIIGKGKILLEGGKLVQPLIIGDYGGGTNTFIALKANEYDAVTPFSQYAIANVWCQVEVDSTSKYMARGKIYAAGTPYESEVCIISNAFENSLIALNNGSKAIITYNQNKSLEDTGTNIYSIGKTTLKVDGGATTGSFQLNLGEINFESIGLNNTSEKAIKTMLKSLGIDTTISADTKEFILPLPYTFDFVFTNGDYKVGSNLAIFPGCNVSFDSNTTLTILDNVELYVMDSNVNGESYSGPDSFKYPETQTLTSKDFLSVGKLILNCKKIIINGWLFTGENAIVLNEEGFSDKNVEINHNINECKISTYVDCQNKEEHLSCNNKPHWHEHKESCYKCFDNYEYCYISCGCRNYVIKFGFDSKINISSFDKDFDKEYKVNIFDVFIKNNN